MIFDLLPEILERILHYLNIDDFKKLACTCSSYNEALKEILWDNVRIGHDDLLCLELDPNHNRRFANLKYTSYLSICADNRRFWLEGGVEVSQNYKQVIQNCNPEVFHAMFVPKDAFCVLAKMDNLVELDIGSSDLDDASLKNLCANLKDLRVINLSFTPLSNYGFQYLRKLHALEDISLQQCKISDAGLKNLSTLMCLKRLNISFCIRITDKGMLYLAALRSLKEIDVSACKKLTESGISFISTLVFLEVLKMNNLSISDGAISKLSSLKNLANLEIGLTLVSDVALSYIKHLRSLKYLDIQGNKRITDEAVTKLISLTSLTIIR